MSTTLAPANANATTIGSFGNGRYSALASEVFDSAQAVFKVTPEVADKLARRVSSDFGALFSGSIGMNKVAVGKVNKDGKVTVKEAAASVKGVSLSFPLYALKALNWAAEAGKNGFVYGNTKWAVEPKLQEWMQTL